MGSLPADSAPRVTAFSRIAGYLERIIPTWLYLLVARFGIAGVFFMSGRTKVDGLLTITPSTYALFADEYRVPLLPPDVAAHVATYSEHLFSILLVLGLFTRVSALALLGMTLVIQTFVYPDAWPTHLSWAAILLPLVARGGGAVSLDRALRIPSQNISDRRRPGHVGLEERVRIARRRDC